MILFRQVFARTLVASGILTFPQPAQGQVGITSGLTQVALVAPVPTQASIRQGASRETGRIGGLREASASVSVLVNTGYRLVVKAAGVPSSRIWIRAASGEFQELTANSSITVVEGTQSVGRSEREIQYRIDSVGDDASLPVRYEIAINPQL